MFFAFFSAVGLQRTEAGGDEGDPGPPTQMKDLSIAEGQKVHLGLKVRSALFSVGYRFNSFDVCLSKYRIFDL